MELFGQRLPLYDLALILLGFLVLGGLLLLFHKTRWGALVRAATEDREMLGALGVNQAWLFTGVFFLGAFLAGLGGAAQLPKGGADLLMDLNIIAEAFVVVVVGGMGSVLGAFLAALLIAELNAFGVLVLPEATLVLMFLVMAVVLILRPQGLLGRPQIAGASHQGPVEAPLLPLAVGDYGLIVAGEILVFCLFAASLHFIMGPGGLISFGHAASFGLGAYGAALAVSHLGWPMELALPLGLPAAGLLAFLVGWFCVRLSGVYFAMLTLAAAQIAWSAASQWSGFTGGDDGILGLRAAPWAAGKTAFYYLTLALVGTAVLALRQAVFSPFGLLLRAARDAPQRAEALGIDVARQRWFAFTLAGMAAGLAGALQAFAKGSVFPDQIAIPLSIDGLIMVLLGGLQTLAGPLVGALAYIGLQDLILRLEYWRLILGGLIILLVLLFPLGIVGTLGQLQARALARFRGAVP